jgi:hypothetical protein
MPQDSQLQWVLGGVTSGQQPGTSLRSVFVSH